MATLQITSMRQEVQTIDEGVHLSAGVSYWLTGDYRLNEEHPPLLKMLAALPVIIARPHVPLNAPSWQEGNEWAFARDFLYGSGNDADQLLFLGRLPMVAVSIVLGLVLYLWGRKLAGDWGGIITLGWYAADPNFLAHGRYVTTDVGATLAYAATLYVLLRVLERWHWKRLLLFGVVFGLAQVIKFSAVYLLPLCAIVAIVWYSLHASTRQAKVIIGRAAAILGMSIACSAVIIFAVYQGQVKSGKHDPWVQALFAERNRVVQDGELASKPPAVQSIIQLTDPTTRTGRFVTRVATEVPIPAWSFFKGLILVANHDYWGHLAYLNGKYSNFGWWWYFPEAFLFKTPLATLILIVLGSIALVRTARRRFSTVHPGVWVALGGSAFYFLITLTGHIDLGVRYVFPAYLGVFTLVGLFGAAVIASSRRWLQVVVGGIAALYLVTSALAFPTYTAYFTEFIGTANGPKYLVDSNIDWGQDAKRLHAYLVQKGIPYVCMSYFGQASLTYYGFDFRYLPTQDDPHTPADINCVVAISVTSLLSQDGSYWWLKAYEPDARVGGSIYVYDFRNGRTPSFAR